MAKIQNSENSDLMLAIELAKEKRDKTIEQLVELLKLDVVSENKEKVDRYIEGILKMNDSIKLMEDAVVAVKTYKFDQKINEEHNK